MESRTLMEKVCQSKKKEGNKMKTRCEIYSRVVGYIRPTYLFNDSQYQQYLDRKVFDKKGVSYEQQTKF